jgi:hypothetical protein
MSCSVSMKQMDDMCKPRSFPSLDPLKPAFLMSLDVVFPELHVTQEATLSMS